VPPARIELPAGKPADYVPVVADVVYEAMKKENWSFGYGIAQYA
jgi:hypothetical protein